ncbi:DNA-binding transcriptional response regulator, NtrC family, contains REC, AAA-type ATPase, and a Fis-type DNA-binding domains [Paucidesulfovibrio gracilis DSM 16080]|uniref:DNA-binding transcriptional response regulator, NtrC family, contains REC, AAA-type ATPase, and a Fis-type DNA-binding domains n=1 Tax=Paucidesulfovibrio gracilis DSM 16080 TaxID=1121449 RepID=A0A1T4XDD8_9BACT|nr:sigma-54 dependent transcriptional regulator [Paucidesulfovibrio gracilis]SKA87583.1 DNA-binding transcriptional response regulator, NtrC family, contains REC, AAA-type ATPase, and a Fis-type DNA-binding domains [Paucidesulfovibrio gracilis DSM 16080]
MMDASILVIEDERIARENLTHVLTSAGHRVTAMVSAEEGLRELEQQEYELVVTDLMLPGMSGMELLKRVRERFPAVMVIMVTGYATVANAVEAMQKGAHSYIAKPIKLDELRLQVERALEQRALSVEVLRLRKLVAEGKSDFPLVGQSEPLIRLKDTVRQLAQMNCNVLIQGETGTGKELIAQGIHQLSRRADERFMAINCGTFTAELMDKELFGHEKEAFTGANRGQKGILEAADGGTVFFDEIGELELTMQVKLLRVLQERNFLRVGGVKEIPVDIRVVAATNCDLRELVERGTFRQDLYYRLNVVTLQAPPLREHREDIPILIGHFLEKHRQPGQTVRSIAQDTLDILMRYPFPGNVRELENLVQRALALGQGPSFTPDLLPVEIGNARTEASFSTLEGVEKAHIRKVLAASGGNKTQAARVLGIDRVSLWRKIKRFGLE